MRYFFMYGLPVRLLLHEQRHERSSSTLLSTLHLHDANKVNLLRNGLILHNFQVHLVVIYTRLV